MKKYIKISFLYAVLAMASGVFYREFTKFNDFTAKTALSVTHFHLFVLGTIVLLIIGLLAERSNLEAVKTFRPAMIVYHIGLPFMVAMFYVRGILQVLGSDLSQAADLAVSGVAGIGHVLMATGIVLLFVSLMKAEYRK
ncbi:MAG TPA: DUF2871 domain-containing protein [Candidatus Stercoripulliclostridium merdipullorum]|uniref:DUF2871 domain-containing protein n=1 Tax=Candidatus Stercoripulliclostridium merdipullorum TaxID=2840952 RepID=A0A9D1SXC2_9FIRM|nr:DUF2871 domain-containing protein [Candidatus Stercoripulliclostridium merdipullorum]